MKVGAGSERVARGRARENEVGHYATHAHRGVGISRLVYDRRNGDDKWGINAKNVAKYVPTARPSLHSHAPQFTTILTSHVLALETVDGDMGGMCEQLGTLIQCNPS